MVTKSLHLLFSNLETTPATKNAQAVPRNIPVIASVYGLEGTKRIVLRSEKNLTGRSSLSDRNTIDHSRIEASGTDSTRLDVHARTRTPTSNVLASVTN
jgi:hypothetical protein